MNSQKLEQTWQEVCDQVKRYDNIDPSQIDAFFSRLQPQAMSEGFLMLTADNDFIKTWIERHYLAFIRQALEDLFGVPFTVFVEVDTAPAAPAPTMAAPTPAAATAAPAIQGTGQQGATVPAATTPTLTPAAEPAAASGTADPAATVPASIPTPGRTEETAAAYRAAAGETTGQSPASPQPSASAAGGDGAADTSSASTPASEAGASGPANTPNASSTSNTPSAGDAGDDGIASSLTFENFVIGDSNRMAYSMAVSVAEMPGKSHLNPLFIYGKSGLGKTHLMRAVQNYINETMPHLSTVYVDSAELLSDYMEASAAHDKEKSSYKNFKTRYEEADVLLIDDVQYLQGKKQTLDIVFQIFNKMTSQGKQVVLSADRAPKNIDIDERYISRFNSGGTFDIQPPEIETKLGIVKSFIDEYREAEGPQDLAVPQDIQMYIAECSGSNIRELKSAVTKVIYQIVFFKRSDITLDDVRVLLENHFTGGPSKRLTVGDIQKEVEAFYKVSHADLLSTSRKRNIAYARQVAIYLCRQMLDLPFNSIGKSFGDRDHSTVMYSVANIEDKMKENRVLREELETLRQLIRDM